MKNYTPYDISALILARLNNTITPEEEKALEEWLGQSVHHQELCQDLSRRYTPQYLKQLYSEHHYQTFYESCYRQIRQKRIKRITRHVIYIAAAVIPLLFLSLWYMLQFRDNLSPQGPILPGISEARLILPEGKIITLNSNQSLQQNIGDHIIAEQDTLKYIPTTRPADQEHILQIPRGGEYVLLLCDGTRVWLNAETELKYLPVFSGHERKVFLKGEAYFEVSANPSMPFIVETPHQTLTVVGTSFCIRAYEDEQQILTTLESGKVNIKSGQQEADLSPGEQATVASGNIRIAKVNTALFTAWHQGIFIFDDQTLEDILHTLSRWYNISVSYSDPRLQKISFTGEVKRYEHIEEFLNKIEELEKVRFNISGRTITVYPYK